MLLVTLMIAVPEYGYPSMWLFLGIAYHEILEVKATPVPEPVRRIQPNARGESSMIKRIAGSGTAFFALRSGAPARAVLGRRRYTLRVSRGDVTNASPSAERTASARSGTHWSSIETRPGIDSR